jgi:hypothetical protein
MTESATLQDPVHPRPPEPEGPAVCVFAVCPREAAPSLAGIAGHAEGVGPVRTVPVGRLSVVVQDVPAAAFTPEELRRRLAEHDALERHARAHHAVVAAAADAGPTVPLPLATLYLSEERARQAVARDAERFLAVLARVAGRAEWGVKVSAADPAPPTSAASPGPPGADAAPASGRAYLDRVRNRQRAREDRRRTAVVAAERVDAELRRIAAAARRLRPHDGGSGDPERGRQVLNATYLVDTHRAAELTARVAELCRDPEVGGRVRVEVTGPWAPYSFAGGSDADADG